MFQIFRTVTARITILFMLLFSILALIMYVVVGHGLSKRFIKAIDTDLDVRAHNTYKYVLNNHDEVNKYDLDAIRLHIEDRLASGESIDTAEIVNLTTVEVAI